eukprot:Plantae.Rhodophyta-Hildenbrandia_rubra.ctg9731.p1 GENE.Plantae.Rhodophyta-Hildenbrandia_rubra.ctg9731~~Plantae.Rhodophyta-Hildenbrandia_rubra.ctg9731.p1  ORF type:complete len:298 (-),score=71.11 Plantae.Rhodophyta-Hildenbrandia_rubra.ctg9731:2464-3357(-)
MDAVQLTLRRFCRDLRLSSFASTHDLAVSAAKLFKLLPLSTFDEATSRLLAVHPHPLLESLSLRIHRIKNTIKDTSALSDALEEVVDDVIEGPDHIASLTTSLIQEGDVILAFATDRLALECIRVAAEELEGKRFSVILTIAHNESEEMVKESVKLPENVSVKFAPDSSPVALMRKTAAVFISAEVLQCDGTVVARNGAAVIASAARRAAVPLVALAPLYSLALRDSELVTRMKDESGHPGSIWEYEKVCLKRSGAGMLRVLNPKWDFVKVNLVVTEYGGVCPEYIQKMANEIYGPE